jgi:signal recognition particle subunit SRP68
MDITKFIVDLREAAFLVGDYSTYRAHLSRRLRIVRKKVGRATAKNAKYSDKAPTTAEDIKKDVEFLHLQLLTSERAWAHAMAMKAAHSEDNADKNITGATRSHIISRLHKAARNAKNLVELLSDQAASGATDIDVLEARGYAFSLAGVEDFETQAEGTKPKDAPSDRWVSCLQNFSAARVIYNSLLKATKKDVFKEVLAGTTDPSIRYAAYQHRIPRTVSVPDVAKKFFPKEDTELVKSLEKIDASAFEVEEAMAISTSIVHLPSLQLTQTQLQPSSGEIEPRT